MRAYACVCFRGEESIRVRAVHGCICVPVKGEGEGGGRNGGVSIQKDSEEPCVM